MKLQYKTITQVGKRENNEDCFYPKQTKDKVENLFMVCDGVGGADKGEVASNIACSAIAEYFKSNTNKQMDDTFIQQAVRQSEQGMRNFISQNPDSKGMATTLTLLYFRSDKAIIAHCGDSRVYQVRNGEIKYVTKDHSLVNELLATGFIKSEEDAKKHPKKNVITRALSGGKDHAEADTYLIEDLQNDDYFLLCSDGVLESLNDEDIQRLFTKDNTLIKIIDEINILCAENSDDNYTAVIVRIDEVPQNLSITNKTPFEEKEHSDSSNEIITSGTLTEEEIIEERKEDAETIIRKSNSPIKYILILISLILIAYAGWIFFKQKKEGKNHNQKKEISIPQKEVDTKTDKLVHKNPESVNTQNTKPSKKNLQTNKAEDKKLKINSLVQPQLNSTPNQIKNAPIVNKDTNTEQIEKLK